MPALVTTIAETLMAPLNVVAARDILLIVMGALVMVCQ